MLTVRAPGALLLARHGSCAVGMAGAALGGAPRHRLVLDTPPAVMPTSAEVLAAHDAGLSWTFIGAVLGISRQAARQRFESPVPT